MKMSRFIVFCFLAAAFAIPLAAADARSAKRPHDWRKSEAEHLKMREKIREEHKKHLETLKNFHQQYNAEKDPAKKDAIRAELQKYLTADFNKRIEYSKKRIENMKKLVARLEEQQKKAESQTAEIIAKRTSDVLNGNIMPQNKPKFKK